MATIERVSDEPYSVRFGTADISNIANAVRGVPEKYINDEGNGITEAGLRYLAPLIVGECSPEYEAGMPKHLIL